MYHRDRLLLVGLRVGGPSVSIDAKPEGFRPGPFAARPFRAEGRVGSCRGQGALQFPDGIEDTAGEDRAWVISLGAFPGRTDDSRALLRDLAFKDTHS